MVCLADEIERYLKDLLAKSPTGEVEIQRNALALQFHCAPSQINYVLTTRFTLGHGFYVESRRGRGGYLRIARLASRNYKDLVRQVFDFIGESVAESEAVAVIERIATEGLLSPREAALMREVVSTDLGKAGPSLRNALRAELLKVIVAAVLKQKGI